MSARDQGGIRSKFAFSRLISANIRVKAISEVVVKAGRFLLILFAARVLGPEGFGIYSFTFAFGNILANASDFGLQMYLSREVSQNTERRAAVLGQVIRAKLLLLVAVAAILIIAALAYPRPSDVRVLMVLMGIVTFLHSWNELWNYFFRGIQSLREEAILNLLNMVVGTGLGIALLFLGKGLLGLTVGLLTAEVLTSVIALRLLRRAGAFDMQAASGPARSAIRDAAPVGVAILLSILYFRIDILFLERMRGDASVGAYSAAYKILESFLFVPAIFLAALYPAFAEKVRTSLQEMKNLYRMSLRWMVVLSGGILIGCLLLASLGLRILYGPGYDHAAPILRVLSVSLPFIFVNYALTHFLVALRGQKWNAVFAGACVLVNVVLNYLAIPRFGGIGAAATTVVTEATLFALCLLMVRRYMAAHERDWTDPLQDREKAR